MKRLEKYDAERLEVNSSLRRSHRKRSGTIQCLCTLLVTSPDLEANDTIIDSLVYLGFVFVFSLR